MNEPAQIPLYEDETLDEMFQGKLKVIQKKNGYRFSIDAVLLARTFGATKTDRIIDLGTGCGIVPLILGRSGKGREIVGIELQEELADIARRNVSLNGFAEKISIRCDDITKITSRYSPGSFDCVVSNPPFRKLATGRVNLEEQKSVARHEIAITLEGLLSASAHLLTAHGRLGLIYPALRAVDLFSLMRQSGIEPKTLQWVHGRVNMPAKMVLVEGIKGGGVELEVKEPLILYDDDGSYTEELRAIYLLP